MTKQRFQIPIFSAIILRKNNTVLLMKRPTNIVSGGCYAFPGGGLDGQETVTTATVREAQEELGITLNPDTLKFMHVLHVKTEAGNEYINFFFETDSWSGQPTIMEPDKCNGLTWFDLDKLPETIMPSHKQVLHMLTKNNSYSEFGW